MATHAPSVANQLISKFHINVVLVSPQIPQNTGSIGRTCLAFGAALHLVGPYGFSLDEKSLKRAGLDYWKYVDLHEYLSWQQFEKTKWPQLSKNAFFFSKFGTTSMLDVNFVPYPFNPSASKSIEYSNSYLSDQQITLLFGSETKGLHKLIGEDFVNQQTTVYMPMMNLNQRIADIPSFNLAASVAMSLWEAFRQAKTASQHPSL